MPAFGFLFRDRRGPDLVAYLDSLHATETSQHLAEEKEWQPSAAALAQANAANGELLYRRDCATCHDANGATRRAWLSDFRQLPAEFPNGQCIYLSSADSQQLRLARLAQITKFGIPGTDMPGHEYLPDRDISSISLWLSQAIAQSNYIQ